MKICAYCNETKRKNYFYQDGRDNYCKPCRRAWRKRHYTNNRAYTIQKTSEYQKENKEKAAESTRRWIRKNKDKHKQSCERYQKRNRLALLMYSQLKEIMKSEGRW